MNTLTRKAEKKKSDAQLSFEEALDNLDSIVNELEEGTIGLEEALAQYEQGVKLLKQCFKLLEKAERRIELLSGIDADGNPVTEPLDDAELSLDERGQSRSKRRSQPGKSGKKRSPTLSDMDVPRHLF